jgi:general secretion pathway protein E
LGAHPSSAGTADPITLRQGLRAQLGQHLVDTGKLALPALERAQRLASESGERLEHVLSRLGLVSERDVSDALANLLGLPVANTGDYPEKPVLEDRFNGHFLKQMQIIPLADRPDHVAVAMVDPFDTYAFEAARFAAGKPVQARVAYLAEFEIAFQRLYGEGKSALRHIIDGTSDREADESGEDVERIRDGSNEAPVMRLANHLIARAVEMRASDIHIEPLRDALRVRYRIDGVLREVESPPQQLGASLVSRIKVMAKLNIAERRMPQDGRIRLAVRGNDIDFRISTMPTIHGESVVLRVLDRGNLKLDYTSLGFDERAIASIRDLLRRPHGIVLVTGPTGSGKTTTLYTGLSEISTPDKKILTIEDPVEYQLTGINQVQVKPQIGLTFASALRSFLRQDPDMMMVGEIRDLETAQIAVQAALTGHLILSTLHTNDAASAVTRLLDMGVEDFLLTSTLNGIVAQRLVRSICPHCRERYEASTEMIERLQIAPLITGSAAFLYRPVGCDVCDGTGYQGRAAIVEVLTVSEAIRQAILNHSEAGAIRGIAGREGMRTLHLDGMRKALAGETSAEEVLRATRAG